MNREEYAQRVAAWTWAARTLGQEPDPQRLDGLVEMTERVNVENLKPSIKSAMTSHPSDFLPSPGLVIAASNRIAGNRIEAKRLALHEHRIRQLRIEANQNPASSDQIQDIRDKIKRLAENAKFGETIPWNEQLPRNDSKSIESVKRVVAERVHR